MAAGGPRPLSLPSLLVVIALLPCCFHAVRGIARKAVCYSKGNVSIAIYFEQPSIEDPVSINGEVSGLSRGKHGFHIHTLGDLTNGCDSAGPHFNPMRKNHGAPTDQERHVGDLGNIEANADGVAIVSMNDDDISLVGAHNIIGRSLVVHADPDDLGRGNSSDSKTTGNSGKRIGCCIVGFVSGSNALHSDWRLLVVLLFTVSKRVL